MPEVAPEVSRGKLQLRARPRAQFPSFQSTAAPAEGGGVTATKGKLKVRARQRAPFSLSSASPPPPPPPDPSPAPNTTVNPAPGTRGHAVGLVYRDAGRICSSNDVGRKSFETVLCKADQFLIPLFQRRYCWTQSHWAKLLQDIIKVGPHGHSVGRFLVAHTDNPSLQPSTRDDAGTEAAERAVEPAGTTPSSNDATVQRTAVETKRAPTSLIIIDGQQRATTLMIIMAACRDTAIRRLTPVPEGAQAQQDVSSGAPSYARDKQQALSLCGRVHSALFRSPLAQIMTTSQRWAKNRCAVSPELEVQEADDEIVNQVATLCRLVPTHFDRPAYFNAILPGNRRRKKGKKADKSKSGRGKRKHTKQPAATLSAAAPASTQPAATLSSGAAASTPSAAASASAASSVTSPTASASLTAQTLIPPATPPESSSGFTPCAITCAKAYFMDALGKQGISIDQLRAIVENVLSKMMVMYFNMAGNDLQTAYERMAIAAGIWGNPLVFNPSPGVNMTGTDLTRNLFLAYFQGEEARLFAYRKFWLKAEACSSRTARAQQRSQQHCLESMLTDFLVSLREADGDDVRVVAAFHAPTGAPMTADGVGGAYAALKRFITVAIDQQTKQATDAFVGPWLVVEPVLRQLTDFALTWQYTQDTLNQYPPILPPRAGM